MNNLLLNSRLRKDSEKSLIGKASAPPSTRGDCFSGLSVIHLVVPLLLLFPLVEGLKVDVGCLLVDFVGGKLNFSIFFVIVLVLNDPLAR